MSAFVEVVPATVAPLRFAQSKLSEEEAAKDVPALIQAEIQSASFFPLLRAKTLKTAAEQQFKQFRALLRALVHPEVAWYVKLICGCGVFYIASPVQLIPNFIPIIGQLDDVLVISLCLRLLKRSIDPAVFAACLKESRPHLLPGIPLNLLPSPPSELRNENSMRGLESTPLLSDILGFPQNLAR
jgi:uncharacterized membrane protein YkvA (DUF1232 family)